MQLTWLQAVLYFYVCLCLNRWYLHLYLYLYLNYFLQSSWLARNMSSIFGFTFVFFVFVSIITDLYLSRMLSRSGSWVAGRMSTDEEREAASRSAASVHLHDHAVLPFHLYLYLYLFMHECLYFYLYDYHFLDWQLNWPLTRVQLHFCRKCSVGGWVLPTNRGRQRLFSKYTKLVLT